MPPKISWARKALLTMHDFIKTRLEDDGWGHIHIIDFSKGWPEDRNLVIVQDGHSVPAGKTPVPCIKLNMANVSDRGDLQIGGGLTMEEYFFDALFQCRTQGEEMDLRESIRVSLDDSNLWLLDYDRYPQDNPQRMVQMRVEAVSSLPIYDIENPNIALRWGGMVSWVLTIPRARQIVSNI